MPSNSQPTIISEFDPSDINNVVHVGSTFGAGGLSLVGGPPPSSAPTQKPPPTKYGQVSLMSSEKWICFVKTFD